MLATVGVLHLVRLPKIILFIGLVVLYLAALNVFFLLLNTSHCHLIAFATTFAQALVCIQMSRILSKILESRLYLISKPILAAVILEDIMSAADRLSEK